MKRKQLTLFLDEVESIPIEAIRRKFNPRQYELIKSHITLCREDEIENLSFVQDNLRKIEVDEFELKIGEPKRFAEGKGVFIAVEDEKNQFRKLREMILQTENSTPREHEAHITLMHPRNSTCDDKKFKEILEFELPHKMSIKKISLIEQEIGKEWRTLQEFELKKKKES